MLLCFLVLTLETARRVNRRAVVKKSLHEAILPYLIVGMLGTIPASAPAIFRSVTERHRCAGRTDWLVTPGTGNASKILQKANLIRCRLSCSCWPECSLRHTQQCHRSQAHDKILPAKPHASTSVPRTSRIREYHNDRPNSIKFSSDKIK